MVDINDDQHLSRREFIDVATHILTNIGHTNDDASWLIESHSTITDEWYSHDPSVLGALGLAIVLTNGGSHEQ